MVRSSALSPRIFLASSLGVICALRATLNDGGFRLKASQVQTRIMARMLVRHYFQKITKSAACHNHASSQLFKRFLFKGPWKSANGHDWAGVCSSVCCRIASRNCERHPLPISRNPLRTPIYTYPHSQQAEKNLHLPLSFPSAIQSLSLLVRFLSLSSSAFHAQG